MERQHRIAQLYGYAVCLVAVITFLISMANLVGAIFDLSDPLHSQSFSRGQPSLASFENYKMDILRIPVESQQAAAPGYFPDDQTIRAMYDAARDDRIRSVGLRARRSITVDALLIGICVVLFVLHWKWMKRLDSREA